MKILYTLILVTTFCSCQHVKTSKKEQLHVEYCIFKVEELIARFEREAGVLRDFEPAKTPTNFPAHIVIAARWLVENHKEKYDISDGSSDSISIVYDNAIATLRAVTKNFEGNTSAHGVDVLTPDVASRSLKRASDELELGLKSVLRRRVINGID